jgi:hypothetical protein
MPAPTNPERRNLKWCTTHFLYFITFIRQVQTVAYSKCAYNLGQCKIIYNVKIHELLRNEREKHIIN